MWSIPLVNTTVCHRATSYWMEQSRGVFNLLAKGTQSPIKLSPKINSVVTGNKTTSVQIQA